MKDTKNTPKVYVHITRSDGTWMARLMHGDRNTYFVARGLTSVGAYVHLFTTYRTAAPFRDLINKSTNQRLKDTLKAFESVVLYSMVGLSRTHVAYIQAEILSKVQTQLNVVDALRESRERGENLDVVREYARVQTAGTFLGLKEGQEY